MTIRVAVQASASPTMAGPVSRAWTISVSMVRLYSAAICSTPSRTSSPCSTWLSTGADSGSDRVTSMTCTAYTWAGSFASRPRVAIRQARRTVSSSTWCPATVTRMRGTACWLMAASPGRSGVGAPGRPAPHHPGAERHHHEGHRDLDPAADRAVRFSDEEVHEDPDSQGKREDAHEGERESHRAQC